MSLFTKKDLGLLLPDNEPGDALSLRHSRNLEEREDYEAPQPKIDTSKKVFRYRAGHVPEFAVGELMPDDGPRFLSQKKNQRANKAEEISPAIQLPRKERQKVVAQVVRASAPPAPKFAAPLVDSDQDSSDEDIDRRARLRSKLLAQRKDEGTSLETLAITETTETSAIQEAQTPIVRSTLESDSESSEWETDTDTSDDEQMLKPIYVPKKARDTIREQEEKLEVMEQREQQRVEKALEKKVETKKMVAEVLLREDAEAQRLQEESTDSEMPDDTDGINPEKERQEWELREMRRLKRDRDGREERVRQLQETLRRRNMTDEEREKEDMASGKMKEKEKKKWKFLQKYYHKGAFYVDDSSVKTEKDVRRRDADEPTLEDKLNRENLPTVMQVKNFGKSGRTKYTHLTDQDTTDFINPLKNDDLREQYASKLSGLKPIKPNPYKRQRR